MVNNWTEDNLISIRERVYLHIKDLILDGEFKAGTGWWNGSLLSG